MSYTVVLKIDGDLCIARVEADSQQQAMLHAVGMYNSGELKGVQDCASNMAYAVGADGAVQHCAVGD